MPMPSNKFQFDLINQAPSSIAIFDRKLRYISASDGWLKDYGVEREEIIGKSHYDVFPEISDEWKRIHQECLNGAVRKREEDKFEREDGSAQWIKWEVKPWFNDKNEIGGIAMYTSDITTIKNEKILLDRYKELLEKSNQAARIGLFTHSKKTDTVSFNLIAQKILGLNDEVVSFNQFTELNVTQSKILSLRDVLYKTYEEQSNDFETTIINPKTDSKVRLRIITIGKISNGEKIHGLIQDVTKNYNLLKKTEKSEKLFRQSFESAAIGKALVGLDGSWLRANKSLSQLLKYPKEELYEKTFQDLTHPDDLEKDLTLLNETIEGKRTGYKIEKRYFDKEGNVIWGFLAVTLVRDENDNPMHFISQITDITERKKALNSLSHERDRLNRILQASTHVAIIETDNNGQITTFNSGAKNLFEIDKDRATNGLNIFNILKCEENHESIKDIRAKINSLLTDRKFSTSEQTFCRDDNSKFTGMVTITPVAENEKNEGFLFVVSDISEVKRAEAEIKKLLRTTKDQNDRLLNFAHIVSHNLRSHSGNIAMLLDLFVQEKEEIKDTEYYEMLDTAATNLQNTIEHLSEVVTINNETNDNFKAVEINKIIDNALKSISSQIQKTRAEINIDIQEPLIIYGVEAYFESIFLNFLTNAIKYKTPNIHPLVNIRSKKNNNNTIEIAIEDNGTGLDLNKHGKKLFGMYKTFHGNEDARGVGLFITKNQIEAMNGSVDVDSTPGKGTTFTLTFPYEEN